MKLFLVFGTSITWGAWDPEGGWVARLRKYCSKNHFVYNLGVSGDTSQDVVRRFEFEARQRLEDFAPEEVIMIFEVGGNDAAWVVAEGKRALTNWSLRTT